MTALRARVLPILTLICLVAGAATAGAARAVTAGPPQADQELRCLGADTMQTLLADWAVGFNATTSDSAVVVGTGTRYSAAGVAATLAGQANCISFAREPFPSERASVERVLGRKLLVIPVAGGSYATPHGTFALAVYVNRSNPLRGLDMAQLAAVFSGRLRSGSNHVMMTWGELGLRGVWAKRPIHLYGMTPLRATGNPPGIVNFLDERVLRGQRWREDLQVESDGHGSTALAAIVRQVGRDPDGIGYSGFGYATEAVRAVPLSLHAGRSFVTGSDAEVAAGHYALARQIYLGFPSMPSGGLSPPACRFLTYVLSPRGQQQVARDSMHFLPLTPSQRQDALRKWARDCDTTPPAYLDRHGAVRIVGYNDMLWMLHVWSRVILSRIGSGVWAPPVM